MERAGGQGPREERIHVPGQIAAEAVGVQGGQFHPFGLVAGGDAFLLPYTH